jgi:hypothetical protein
MISKKDFCLSILGDYCRENNKKFEELNDGDVFMSSSVAVAMEHLDMIKSKDIKEYARSRGGTYATYLNEKERYYAQLSVREMIGLLPEKVDYEIWS